MSAGPCLPSATGPSAPSTVLALRDSPTNKQNTCSINERACLCYSSFFCLFSRFVISFCSLKGWYFSISIITDDHLCVFNLKKDFSPLRLRYICFDFLSCSTCSKKNQWFGQWHWQHLDWIHVCIQLGGRGIMIG